MSAAIKQIVTVRAGGVVEVRSPELNEGDQAQVTVTVVSSAKIQQDSAPIDDWRHYAGALSSADTHGGDNDRIDADLAAE
jgi:hypothetical protein